MKGSVLALLAFVLGALLLASPAYAGEKVKKTITIDRDVVENARGTDVVSGRVTKVGHEIIYVEDGSGRRKIDLDDIGFPRPVKELFDEETHVIATGRLKGGTLFAHRIIVVRDGVRRTYVSRKPVDITIKGEKDIKLRVNP